jgi:hypothetical protein
MAHDFKECQESILGDVEKAYVGFAYFWKSVVSGALTMFVLLAVPAFLWAKHNDTVQQLNVLRIGQLEQALKDVKDSREDIHLMLVNQRQMMTEWERDVAQIKRNLR